MSASDQANQPAKTRQRWLRRKTESARTGRADLDQPGQRSLETPEGVPLPIQLADRADRVAALVADTTLLGIATAGIWLLGQFVWRDLDGLARELVIAAAILLSFLVRTFYFIYFELRWQGATPGKRWMGLKVIDRQGGPLRADAVFARNLIREVEIYLPIYALIVVNLVPFVGLSTLFLAAWLMVPLIVPLASRDRMRIGDYIAGTWVIRAPRTVLLEDLAGVAPRPVATSVPTTAPPAAASARFRFTPAQLEVYGVFELQTLERVLRTEGAEHEKTVREVANRIARKIDWETGEAPQDARGFLTAFYTALRNHLETRGLFGTQKADKHDRT